LTLHLLNDKAACIAALFFVILACKHKDLIMILSVEQIKQLHTMLQEYPKTDYVVIRSEGNGSGIGPSEFADFYDGDLLKPQLLGTIEITEVGFW
jgi:hypothetical protein